MKHACNEWLLLFEETHDLKVQNSASVLMALTARAYPRQRLFDTLSDLKAFLSPTLPPG